jgi:hypothetical protein
MIVGEDRFDGRFGLTYGDGFPVFIASEIRKCEAVWDSQRVSVLCGDCETSKQDRQGCQHRNKWSPAAFKEVSKKKM